MGKSAPTPPPAPDPSTIINASANAADQTAQFQSGLNNVNYQGPQGSVSYSMNSPGRWTEDVQLNPTEQETYDTVDSANNRAAQTANQQILNVDNALQNSNLQAPTLQTGAPIGALQTGYNPGGQIAYGYSPGGGIQSQVAPSYSPYGGYSANPYGTGAYGPGAQGMQPQPQPQPPSPSPAAALAASSTLGSSSSGPVGMKYDDSSGWIPTQQYGVDTTGAHPGEMYGPNGWVPATSQAIYPSSQTPAPTPASTLATSSAPTQPPAAAPQGYGPSYGQGPSQAGSLASILSNPVLGTQAATYAQAAQLLNPQWQQAGEQQQAQLTAQGRNPNSAAYQNAMTLFGNQENEAYDQAAFNAINAGNAEQNTLYGQNLSSGQFANQAQAQLYGENQGLAQFNNAAQAQANSQNAGAAAFQNQALGQNWQEQDQNAQLANQAAQQQFQDQAYAGQLPINEFTALLGDSQVAMPPSAPAQNTPVQTPSVLGAYGLQQTALQNAYQDQLQNNQSGLTGLFNLGASALSLL